MAGCYGKIPTLGDFLSRNLQATFVDTWDGWLRRVMSVCARSGGAQWVDSYLSSPIWRFAIGPGVAGPTGWAGILVPSVDSVGRCFPLTVAVDTPSSMPAVDMASEWADGYERAEIVAIGALGRALTPEAFVERIAALHGPTPPVLPGEPAVETWSDPSQPARGVRTAGAPPESGEASAVASRLALALMSEAKEGMSLWWHLDWEGRPATTALFAGLPPPEAVASMLLGSLEDRDWSR